MSKKPLKYFSLSPATDVNAPIYFEALDEKLYDDSIKNIAITGSYGSGKSSILDSYFTNRKEVKSLRVSLANFCESNSKIAPTDEKIIEEHILQQLFYQLSHENIPYSGFKKISHLDNKAQTKFVIITIIWLFSITLIPNIFNLFNQNIQTISTIGIKQFVNQVLWFSTIINILTFTIFSIGLFKIVKGVIRLIQKGQLKKVVMKSAQVELSEDSALNKHIDELIYFFEATDNTIIIIEDLDRFNSVKLFSKLREVNFLINNSPKVSQVVKFIYAIRDEVFTDNLIRTKFFDFILPIVPVINTTNSGDKLRDYLKNDKTIPDVFINDISLYIHDLRLLKNIVNEYRVYSGVINEDNKKRSNSLFSIILYKNLFPTEFGLEHSEKGLLYEIFKKKKNQLIQSLIDNKKENVDRLENERDAIVNATTINGEKLREEYVMEIMRTYQHVFSICNYSISDIISNNDYFNSLLSRPVINFHEPNYNRQRQQNIDFGEIQERVNPNFTYQERLELLNQSKDDNFKELDNQITKLKNEISSLQRNKLSGLIKHYQDNSWKNILFGNNENGFSPEVELLALLVRKGYINENYQLFMSYFYEGALNLEDFEFLLNVKNSEGDNFNKEVTNINELISRISIDEYEYSATLNKDLIFHLLKKSNYKSEKRLELLLMQFSFLENSFEKYIFPLFEKFKDHKKELQRFIELLVEKYYPIIWQSIDKQNYDDKTKDKFVKLFIFLPEKHIQALNYSSGQNSLKNYLSTKVNFIDVFDLPEEMGNITNLIKALNIKFQNLAFKSYDNNHIFNYIYQNNHYVLNKEMLYLMLFSKIKIAKSEFDRLFNEQNFSTIIESNEDSLNSYITSNLQTYLNNIYLKLEKSQAESEKAIAYFIMQLNSDEETDILKSVLCKISTRISDIEKFGNNEKWSLLFDTDTVKPTWGNLIAYFKLEETTLITTIINWLNDNNINEELTKNKLSKDHFTEDKEVVSTFMSQIIENNDLDNDSYAKLLLSLPYIFNQTALDELSVEKISKLIKYGKIKFNPHHYELLINLELSNELFLFASHNITIFIEDYDVYKFDLELHKKLLESKDVVFSDKERLINLVSIENLKYPELASLICNVLINIKDKTINNERIITSLLECESIELKLKVFNKFLDKFDFNEIDKIFADIGGVYKKATKLRNRPRWKKNSINQSIAQKLNDIGYFNSFAIYDKKDEIKIVVRYE